MVSATVFDIISLKLNKVLSTDLIPKFSEIATEVVSNFGDEPPSKESMMVLFENAFKQALASPRPKKEKKASTPKAETPKKEKKASTPKKGRAPVPKPQWITKQEMEDILEKHPGEKYFCGFVADRGPNKGKFCACELTEEAKNCGVLTEDGWIAHSPATEGTTHEARCRKCWGNGKNGPYKKVGAFDKLYNKVEVESPKPKKKSAKKTKKEEIPAIPDVPEPVTDNEVYNKETDDEDEIMNKDTDDVESKVMLEVSEQEDDSDDEQSTEELLDGLLD